jgi:hypothetical protein
MLLYVTMLHCWAVILCAVVEKLCCLQISEATISFFKLEAVRVGTWDGWKWKLKNLSRSMQSSHFLAGGTQTLSDR